jgi:hypothetical protein
VIGKAEDMDEPSKDIGKKEKRKSKERRYSNARKEIMKDT